MGSRHIISRIALRGHDEVYVFLDGLLREGYVILNRDGDRRVCLGKYEDETTVS